ncbi:MAG: AI-2E family transporter, partial [Pseudomonadales bacterium]
AGFFEWLEASGFELNIVPLAELIRPEQAFPLAGSLLSSFGSLMTNALVILLTVIFILTEEVSLYQKLEDVLPQTSKASDTIRAVTRLVNQYMAIKAAISAFTGILAWGLCVVLGVEYAVLWGTLAFLLNFIPTFGSLLAAIPPLLLALVQTGPLASLGVAAGYLVINTVVGNIIEPRVMGRGLGLSPLVVLVSLIFWGWVLGPVGMLLSVPLTMMIKIALEIFPDTRWIGTLLGNGLNLELSPEEEAI